MKRTICVVLCFITTIGWTQTEEDALRYSLTEFGGTARYNSVCGAFGALGADLTVLSTNPAGMARFKNSEFTITGGLVLAGAKSTFNGTASTDGKENFNLGNIGVVGVSKATEDTPTPWRSVQFGFAYNRLANFNNRFNVNGEHNNSLSYELANLGANTIPNQLEIYNPFDAYIAYEAFLIDPDSTGSNYTTQMYVNQIEMDQTTTTSGSMGESVLALSGNYADRVYIGASLGFPRIRYERERVHIENSLIDSTDLRSFSYTENNRTTGSGMNLKLGIIAVPVEWLRLGLAYHTRSSLTLRDYWSSQVSTSFSNGDQFLVNSPVPGSHVYKLKTPRRIMASAAIVVAKSGMISVDVERVSYTNASLNLHPFSGDSYNYTAENATIQTNYRAVNNIRIGGEYRISKPWMLRAGYALYQNPYDITVVATQEPRISYSGGFGYRTKDFYADVAYKVTKWTEDYYMYNPALVSNAALEHSVGQLLFTIGTKF